MEKEEKLTLNQKIVIQFFIALALVAISLIVYFHISKKHILEQNKEFLSMSVEETNHVLEDLFETSEKNISYNAYMFEKLYSDDMQSLEGVDQRLKDMSEHSPFDHIRFINKDGMGISGNGDIKDLSNRNYFKEAMNDNNGVEIIEKSAFTNSIVIVFYSPLYQDNEIVGVMTGVLREENLAKRLASEYCGENTDTYLVKSNGDILVGGSELEEDNLLAFSNTIGCSP